MNYDVKNLGEPLTIEQLREMDRYCVWVESLDNFFESRMIEVRMKGNTILGMVFDVADGGGAKVVISEETYGRKWIAYRHQPIATELQPTCNDVANLNGCPYCKPDAEGWVKVFGAYSIHGGMLETGHCKPQKIMYRPHCGTPLNDEAQTMLEKRLRGCGE